MEERGANWRVPEGLSPQWRDPCPGRSAPMIGGVCPNSQGRPQVVECGGRVAYSPSLNICTKVSGFVLYVPFIYTILVIYTT